MADTRRLRARFLAALVPCGVVAGVAAGCGGTTGTDTGGSGATGGTSGNGGSGGTAQDGGGTAGSSAGAAGTPSCQPGVTPSEQCYTLAELEALVNNPPQGGDIGIDAGLDAALDVGLDAWITVTECLPREEVQNSCCNTASYGPTKQGELCCYVFCTGACCGRPFVVEGRARVAGVVARRDWMAGEVGASDDLDPVTRRALADAWLADARMEHASIASFARFTLELLALGAPPELVRGAQLAALDEIEHAKLCFGIAARFAGEPLGPGELSVADAELGGSLAECAARALCEGCIGESVSALMAREQATEALDPDVSSALARIADDEERHAELAWRFVAWAIATGGDDVRRAVDAALASALDPPRPGSSSELPTGVDARAWRRFGRLARSAEDAVIAAALEDVIGPCARALLGEPEARLRAAV